MRRGIELRKPEMGDVKTLVELEKKIWGDMYANESRWVSRINIFPDGMRIAEKKGEIVGVVSTLIINWKYPKNVFPTWAEASGNGMITNHDPNGNVLYGIDLGVLPRNLGAARELVKFTVDLYRELSLQGGGLGCRIPSMARYVEENKIREVTSELVGKVALDDTQVSFWISCGFDIVAPKEAYFPEDEESLGWGIILHISGTPKFWC